MYKYSITSKQHNIINQTYKNNIRLNLITDQSPIFVAQQGQQKKSTKFTNTDNDKLHVYKISL